MRAHILVVSHGRLCEEIISSAEMLVGTLKDVHAICLMPGMDPSQYRTDIEEHLKQAPAGSLVLVDIFGGTPFNTVVSLSQQYEIGIVTGVNMTMLIEADNVRQTCSGPELAAEVRERGADACIDVMEMMKTGTEGG